jgi:hypothetical protein
MSAAIQENTEEQWKAVRGLLKEALLAGEIPLEPKEMYPKAVFTLSECKQPRHCIWGKVHTHATWPSEETQEWRSSE